MNIYFKMNFYEYYLMLSAIQSRLISRLLSYLASVFNNSSYERIQPPSLRNIGATCYLNSAFQGISACDTFVKEIGNLSRVNQEAKKLQIFKTLIDILNGCSDSDLEISRNAIFCKWNKSGQQDSYELLAYALNEVYNEIRQIKENNDDIPRRDLDKWLSVKLPMRHLLQYTITCGECSTKSLSPLQSDLAFHIAIPSEKQLLNLSQLFDLNFEEDTIQDYECDKKGCSGKGTQRKPKLCKPLPRTICVHLQRTKWNGSKMNKINTFIEFSTTFCLKSKYIRDEDNNNETSEHVKLKEKVDVDVVQNNNNSSSNFAEEKSFDESENISNLTEGTMNAKLNDGSPMHNNNKTSVDIDKSIDKQQNAGLNFKESSESIENIESTNSDVNRIIQEISTNGQNKNKNVDHIIISMPEKDENNMNPNEGQIYDLVSVIEHSGSAYYGHYICYKKMGDQWFLTNDSWIQKVKPEVVLKCQAYILFYEQPYKDK